MKPEMRVRVVIWFDLIVKWDKYQVWERPKAFFLFLFSEPDLDRVKIKQRKKETQDYDTERRKAVFDP